MFFALRLSSRGELLDRGANVLVARSFTCLHGRQPAGRQRSNEGCPNHTAPAQIPTPGFARPSSPSQVGDPFDESVAQGPLVSEKQMEKVMKYIELGQKEGGCDLTVAAMATCGRVAGSFSVGKS